VGESLFSFIPNHYLLVAFGFLLLIKGGDWFVDAATSIAKRFKLPELLIGATVVSIGTTLPEVMTSVLGAVQGSGSAAFGNAIGSIICNTSLIAALTIAIKPAKANRKTLIFPVCFFFGAMAVYALFAYCFGFFDSWMGIILLVGFVAYMVINVINMKNNPEESDDHENDDALECELPDNESKLAVLKDVAIIVGAALVIALGADVSVANIPAIAKDLGVPDDVVTTTLLALGTSLPELVTAITALMKGHGALSLGNIIGANIFNLVLVSGAAMAISPFALPETKLFDFNASLLVTVPLAAITMAIMTIPTIITGKLRRWQGVTLLCIYGSYCILQFILIPQFS
jgi:cation:H+ antiporter